MNLRRFGCAICGEERLRGKGRFLLVENRWEDKLAGLAPTLIFSRLASLR